MADLELWAPLADEVILDLGDTMLPMEFIESRGVWSAGFALAGGARYAFRIDGGEPVPDPRSPFQPEGVSGPSEAVDHDVFSWTDEHWTAPPLREWTILELHIGTFTPEGTFDAAIERFADLVETGITAIELMPVNQFPGARNWGYDGVDLYAPQNSYGGPDGLKRLIDAAHAHGLAVVLDVVYNHLGPEGNFLPRFGPYFTDAHHTPWGDAVNVDGPGSDHVRRFFIDNATGWITDYHADGLRLDAIHGIVDDSEFPFLGELADAVHLAGEKRGYPAVVIAESDLGDVNVITPREDGGLGHDAQWNDDFHHSLHVALTGEQDNYYADFNGTADLATALQQGFVYTGQFSTARGADHGTDSRGIPGERFVVYAQDHDQIGNRMTGDRLAVHLTPGEQRLALATVLLSPFVPMLFMGEEYGEIAPFPYFIDHSDPALIQAVQEGRASEFAGFADQGTPPDPHAVSTFESAKLDWSLRDHGDHARTLAFVTLALAARQQPSIASLDPAGARVVHRSGAIAVAREAEGQQTLTVLNFRTRPVRLIELTESPVHERWTTILDSDSVTFGGAGETRPGVVPPRSALLLVKP